MNSFKHKLLLCFFTILLGVVVSNAFVSVTDEVSAEELQDEIVIEDAIETEEVSPENAQSISSNDYLFKQYIESRLYKNTADKKSKTRKFRKATLSGINDIIYRKLREQIKDVADGVSDSTIFEVSLEDLGLKEKTWAATDLGVTTIVVNGSITQEAKTALTEKLGIDLEQIITELLFDCPYDLYWYDKEAAIRLSNPKIAAKKIKNVWHLYLTSGLTTSFEVSEDYSTGNKYEVDTSRAVRVNHAVEKAKELVQTAENETDHDKLTEYKNDICELVEYDIHAAYDMTMPYGDPWQVISVFDEDTTTNVVCEGYAKAYQYLCDLTDFEGDVKCISVSGVMTDSNSSEGHMWNILCMGNGKNYLADITNSDDDSTDDPNRLFMAGYISGDIASGYTFKGKTGSLRYIYDKDSISTFDDELILAPQGSCIHNLFRNDAIEPTETEDGQIEYWVCSLCGNLYSDVNAVKEIYPEDIIIPAGTEELDSVYRLYGDTRYETSLQVANDYKEKLRIDQFDTVILADGRNYADALAGSYLSCILDAPILLVDSNQNHITAVQAYIKANLTKNGKIYLLGGTAAVPDKAVTGLSGYRVSRLWGKDRYETNLAILEEATQHKKTNEILVCSGIGFADSLSAAAIGEPILLVKNSLQDSQQQYLKSLNETMTFYIIGGTGAVSDQVKKELIAYGTASRIGGSTRYETSVNVARKFFNSSKAAVLAYGKDFPDGLCGGALAYSERVPLILAANGKTEFVAAYADENAIHVGTVLGGPALISDASVDLIFDSISVIR